MQPLSRSWLGKLEDDVWAKKGTRPWEEGRRHSRPSAKPQASVTLRFLAGLSCVPAEQSALNTAEAPGGAAEHSAP